MVSTSVASLETSHFQLAVVCFPSLACELHEANKGNPPPYFSKTSFSLFLFLSPVSGLEAATERILILKYKTKQNKKTKKMKDKILLTLFLKSRLITNRSTNLHHHCLHCHLCSLSLHVQTFHFFAFQFPSRVHLFL